MKISSVVWLAAALAAASGPANALDVPGFTLVQSLGGIDEWRLDSNGLSILLLPDHSAPVVTLGVAYRVGSRNEVTGSTGSTHLLEHLMFRGSQHFNADRHNDIDDQLERVGAGYNANTWYDRTNYFETVGRDSLGLAFRVESDRMRGLLLREEDRAKEMTVVRNEYERGKNDPSDAMEEEIYAAAYLAYPYHHSTIGWRSDIELVPIEKLRAFYNTYYWPNNATVTVVGDFDPAQALGFVRKYYGVIPRSPQPIPQVYTVEPDQTGPRRLVIKRTGDLGVVEIGYKTPPSLSPDSPAIQVLSAILVNGKGSRLYRAMVDQGLATDVGSDNAYFRAAALDVLFADLAPGVTHAAVEAAMTAEIKKIAAGGVTDQELATAKSQIAASIRFRRDGPTAVTARIEDAIAVGDWTDYVNRPAKIEAVSAAEVQRVAATYFIEDQSTTGWFVPVHGARPPSAEAAALARAQHELPADSAPRDNPTGLKFDSPSADPWASDLADSAGSAGSAGGTSAGNPAAESLAFRVNRRQVAGIDVQSYRTGVKEVVTLVGSLEAGRAANPADNVALADLTALMLDKGTVAHDKFALAQRLSAVGATLQFSAGGETLGFTGKCLRENVPLLIQTLAEELRQPAFDPGELAKAQKNFAGTLLRLKTNPGQQAARAFAELIYPPGHANYIAPLAQLTADAARTTPSDLAAFHRSVFGPASLHLVIVGDVDAAAIDQAVNGNFAGWSGGRKASVSPAPAPLHPGEFQAVRIPDKTSVNLVIGEVDRVRFNDPDRPALELAVSILGEGFTGRLMNVVRTEKGLTYGIGADLAHDVYSAGDLSIRATFAPALLQQGLDATRQVIRGWYEQGVSAAEVADHKTSEIGSFQVGLATTAGLAGVLLNCAQAGIGPEYLDAYPKRVAALTAAEVNAAIQAHLNPDQMVTVVAGTIPDSVTR